MDRVLGAFSAHVPTPPFPLCQTYFIQADMYAETLAHSGGSLYSETSRTAWFCVWVNIISLCASFSLYVFFSSWGEAVSLL